MSASDQNCKSAPGSVTPVIDLNRCEAQSDCVRVCPCNVFVIKPISQREKAQLSLRGKIKTWVHGSKKAYAENAQDCRACALCISACPENAITLQKIE